MRLANGKTSKTRRHYGAILKASRLLAFRYLAARFAGAIPPSESIQGL